MAESVIDLSLATTGELIAELQARSMTLVIGMAPLADKGCYKVYRHGSRLMGAGLIRSLQVDSDAELLSGGKDDST